MTRFAAVTALALLLAGCAGPSIRDEPILDPPGYALPPATEGPLYEMAEAIRTAHGEDISGFHLLDASKPSLDWRLAVIDSAVRSVDIQTYLWYPDNVGLLLLDRAIRAADRGVKVRLIVDDLLTIGLDQAIYEIHRHPNIEFRLFNPWKERGLLSRGGEMVMEMERLNTRMHDKLVIVDGRAAVIGGRNIGDHYFGLGHDYNFHDLDVLGIGPVAKQANALFDHFWNSDWVLSARNLDLEGDPEYARETLANIRERIASAPELARFSRLPQDWQAELDALAGQLHMGPSRVVFDQTEEEAIRQDVVATLFPEMGRATEELLITNAYVIPDQPAIDFMKSLTDRGVKVKILTNSLASHDVPAVNSHYKGWRDDFLRVGVELFEMQANPDIQSSVVEVPPVHGEFVGLHSKAFVVDREWVFIGSMNFDPRSAEINTEMGVYVHSPGLAAELVAVMERDMAPENAWQVHLDEDGDLYWTNAQERVDSQPARHFGQRILDMIFRLFPKELY